MKKILVSIYLFFPLIIYSQINNPKVFPVSSGTFSNNTISYVVGKIYVIPEFNSDKKENKEDKPASNIKIYPNPVTNILFFETFNKSLVKSITISDVAGKLICAEKVDNNSIDLSFLKQGTYIILLDNDKSKTFKIIKN